MTETRGFIAQTPANEGVSKFLQIECPTDTLSDVLEAARLRGEALFRYALSPPFGIAFPAGMRLFHIVQSGTLTVEVGQAKVRLSRGDVLLVPHGHAHSIADAEGRDSVALNDLVPNDIGASPEIGDGGECQWVCGSFKLDDVLAARLLRGLPSIVLLGAQAGQNVDWLEEGCRFALREASNPLPGARVMISRLLDLIFVQILRAWAIGEGAGPGWLSAVTDPKIGKALVAMHSDPRRSWSVDELANHVGQSRSAFAARFTRLVGQTPISYVSELRLDRAAELLRFSPAQIATVAFDIGYSSETAFSRAFKSRFGSSPLHWRKANFGATGNIDGA
jgi:AraC-like DNA-binding protein